MAIAAAILTFMFRNAGNSADREELNKESTWAYEEEAPKDADGVRTPDIKAYESPEGYEISYDASLFTLSEGHGVEMFTFTGEQSFDTPIYVSFLTVKDSTAGKYISAISSNLPRTEVQEISLTTGLSGFKTENLYEADGTGLTVSYLAFQNGNDILLTECRYLNEEPAETAVKNLLESLKIR